MLDLGDPLALAIVEQFGPVDQVGRMVAEAPSRGEVPAVVVGVPRAVACEVADGLIPDFESSLASTAAGDGYVVVAVARGGTTFLTMPPIAD